MGKDCCTWACILSVVALAVSFIVLLCCWMQGSAVIDVGAKIVGCSQQFIPGKQIDQLVIEVNQSAFEKFNEGMDAVRIYKTTGNPGEHSYVPISDPLPAMKIEKGKFVGDYLRKAYYIQCLGQFSVGNDAKATFYASLAKPLDGPQKSYENFLKPTPIGFTTVEYYA